MAYTRYVGYERKDEKKRESMKELNTGSGGEKEIAQSGYQEED